MKTKILYISLFFIALGIQAQPNMERIKALKVAHITDKLNLTEKEAQQFWPIYNAYDESVNKLRRGEMRSIRREIRQKSESMTEQEANALLARLVEAENQIHLERAQLVEKLRDVISPQKIIQLKIAEEDFNRRILEEMKRRRQGRMNKNKPKP